MADLHDAKYEGALKVLDYLLQVAQNTSGAEVWRALFAEQRDNLLRQKAYGAPFGEPHKVFTGG